MVKLLSIDCGIKTMAVCLLEIVQLQKEFPQLYVEQQKILLQIENFIYSREEFKKMIPTFSLLKKQLEFFSKKKFFQILLWKRINLFYPEGCQGNSQCPRPLEFLKDKKPYCSKHKPKDSVSISNNQIKRVSQLEISLLLHKALTILGPQILEVDYVLIEQQPSKNHMIKSIQTKLHEFFIIRGIIDRPIDRSIKHIYLVSPKKKLKSYDVPDEKKLISNLYQTSRAKNSYRKNKDVSIRMTLSILDKNNQKEYYQWLLQLSNAIADDLADSFLQAYCYYHLLPSLRSS